ncbi:MAG: hypothetical protein IPF55_18760 [Rhodoferax sp.]|nr:hypothetical protein [Rhodoferax sp.]
MRRINCPVWALCCTVAATGALAFVMGVLFRTTIPDETLKAKFNTVEAMSKAFDLLKEHKGYLPAKQSLHFTVSRAFSSPGDAVGFTIQALDALTYLILSDDKAVLMLVQQDPDGTNKQCLMHPASIQVGSCQLDRIPQPLAAPRGANQTRP